MQAVLTAVAATKRIASYATAACDEGTFEALVQHSLLCASRPLNMCFAWRELAPTGPFDYVAAVQPAVSWT
jgi:hypothetical protein